MGRPRITRQPKPCARCGQDFIPDRAARIYCSRRCSKIKDLPWKDCERCGEPFRKSAEVSYATWETMRFCSLKCRGNGKALRMLACEQCGAEFSTYRAGRVERFCSHDCASIHQRTVRFPVAGPRYKMTFTKRQKRLLLERDGGCRSCGATEHLEYDHVVPVFRGGSNTIENGQVLCRPCHRAKTTAELRAAV